LPESAKNILLIISSLLVFDVLVIVLGASYLSQNISAFLSKSSTVILSDLLFLEGVVICAIGIFLVVGEATQKIKTFSKPSTEKIVVEGQTPKKRISPGLLAMIIGALLIGLSITVGSLFP